VIPVPWCDADEQITELELADERPGADLQRPFPGRFHPDEFLRGLRKVAGFPFGRLMDPLRRLLLGGSVNQLEDG
jgi:hypothetical protein